MLQRSTASAARHAKASDDLIDQHRTVTSVCHERAYRGNRGGKALLEPQAAQHAWGVIPRVRVGEPCRGMPAFSQCPKPCTHPLVNMDHRSDEIAVWHPRCMSLRPDDRTRPQKRAAAVHGSDFPCGGRQLLGYVTLRPTPEGLVAELRGNIEGLLSLTGEEALCVGTTGSGGSICTAGSYLFVIWSALCEPRYVPRPTWPPPAAVPPCAPRDP